MEGPDPYWRDQVPIGGTMSPLEGPGLQFRDHVPILGARSLSLGHVIQIALQLYINYNYFEEQSLTMVQGRDF